MLALILVAVSVGLGNLAASVGIGVGGVTMKTRMRVILTFGLLEAGMPIVGLLIGHSLAASIGREAKWIAAGLLVAVGCYAIVVALLRPGRSDGSPAGQAGPQGRSAQGRSAQGRSAQGRSAQSRSAQGRSAQGRSAQGRSAQSRSAQGRSAQSQSAREWVKLGLSGLALSLDNLIAGFALGSYQVNLIAGAVAFGVVSVVLSLAGLEVGARLGRKVGDSGEIMGGVVLIGVGVAVGFGLLG
jgi:putative Mn2+ efflux pump MntP